MTKYGVFFDKDDFNDIDFNYAISNQAFEYWLILHFDDH